MNIAHTVKEIIEEEINKNNYILDSVEYVK